VSGKLLLLLLLFFAAAVVVNKPFNMSLSSNDNHIQHCSKYYSQVLAQEKERFREPENLYDYATNNYSCHGWTLDAG
jgi:hypothetical protein